MPRSLWDGGLRDRLAATADALTYGDVADFGNFSGAVIDRRAFDKLAAALDRVQELRRVHGVGRRDLRRQRGVLRPAHAWSSAPTRRTRCSRTEYFGPILGVYVYDDARLRGDGGAQAESVSPYGLTGAVFATDRRAIDWAGDALRFAAGNFYINDKPTGAVVGQQPFGGARASGTNDKAGSWHNLIRWMSPRVIKETFVPPTDYRYPHMG